MATALQTAPEIQNAEGQANVDQAGPVSTDQAAQVGNQDAGGFAQGPGQVGIGNQEGGQASQAGNQDAGQAPQAGTEAPSQSQSSSVGGVAQLRADFNKLLNENQAVSATLDKLEKSTGLKRDQLSYGIAGVVAGIVSLYLLAGAGAAFVANVLIGAVYPGFASLRALHTQDKSQDVQLLAYWSIFGALLLVDSLLSEVPAYFLLKAAGLLALALPQIRGAELAYTRALEPALSKVDALLQKKSEQS